MKIVFNRQQILAAVSPLMIAASGKSTLSAIDGILIEAKYPNTCTFTAYDLEKGVKTTIETEVLEEGRYIINAQKFLGTMRVMDGEEVTFSVDKQLCALFECGRSSHKMIALNGEDFPELPLLESEKGFSLSCGQLRAMLTKTMYAMGVNDQRPVLNGCFFEIEDNSIMLVSCDSFKLAKCKHKEEIKNNNKDGSDLRYRFIIPTKTVNELYKHLDTQIPRSLSCEWDNDGLMCCPDGEREVKKALICLDVTEAVTSFAVKEDFDVIVSHHPFIFKGLKSLDEASFIPRKAMEFIRAGISVMSFHTRLDALAGGVNDALAAVLGLKNVETFEGEGLPLGRVGDLPMPMPLCSFAAFVKEALGAPFVSFVDAGHEVKRVAVVGGSGDDFISVARAIGADTYVSGEFGHHALTDEPDAARGINLIEAGHFYTEQPVCKALSDMIAEIDSAIACDIISSNPIKAI